MIKTTLVVLALAPFMFATNVVNAAGYCSDLPGRCASSPFCLGKKVGATCRTAGSCKSITSQKLKTCCSCVGGKSPQTNQLDRLNRFGEGYYPAGSSYHRGRPNNYQPRYDFENPIKKIDRYKEE